MVNQKKPLWRKVVGVVAKGLFGLVVLVIWLLVGEGGSIDVSNWFLYAVGLIVVAVPVGIILFVKLSKPTTIAKGRTGSPWDVVEAFYRAVQKADLNAAYDLFHPDLQRAQERREFRRLDTDISRLLRKTPRTEVTVPTAQSVTAGTYRDSVVVTTYRDSIVNEEDISSSEFLLSMQNDAWKIAAYRAQDELGQIEGGTFPFEC